MKYRQKMCTLNWNDLFYDTINNTQELPLWLLSCISLSTNLELFKCQPMHVPVMSSLPAAVDSHMNIDLYVTV